MRLFCFHHAGGDGAMFRTWNRALGPRVEVIPVEVANRVRFATLRQLVDEINDQLHHQLDRPHVFFGHSFGALVAYRLACLRAVADSCLPRALILSSYAAPHLPPSVPIVDHLDNDQLAVLLSDLGGFPQELSGWPAFRDKALADTRVDLRLCMTDEDGEAAALPCPIYAFGGSNDPLVSESDLHEWRSRTSEEFSVQILEGGHFYIGDGPRFLDTLRPLLACIAAGGARC
jgi:surfactin synthase thioesterase subunit